MPCNHSTYCTSCVSTPSVKRTLVDVITFISTSEGSIQFCHSHTHPHTHTSCPHCSSHQALRAHCQRADGCVSELSRWAATVGIRELLGTEPSLRLPPRSQFGHSQCQSQHQHYRQGNQTRCQHGSHSRAVRSTRRLWRNVHTHRRGAA